MGWSSSLTSDWRSFVALPAAERRNLLLAACLLPPVTGLLKTAGYKRTQRWLGRVPAAKWRLAAPARTGGPPGPHAAALMLGRIVSVAAEHNPVPSTCLSRSLVLWLLLRRQGIAGEIRLGVARKAGNVVAHAWVEHDGAPLNDTDDVTERYAPLGH